MISNLLLTAPAVITGLLAWQMNVDMAVLQKWEAASVVRFNVVGTHDARAGVVFNDTASTADVTDRITLEFLWNKKTGKIMGEVKVTDSKSAVKNLKSDGTNCPPPALQGDYEHFQYLNHTVDRGELVMLNGERTYPAASVSQYPASCDMRSAAGGKEPKMLSIAAADPAGLAMTMPAGSPVTVSADKKSFVMKGGEGWVWTLTPTVVK
jgi:hypothetical protein